MAFGGCRHCPFAQRRADVVDSHEADRLVTAVIVEQHDEWAVAERRYLSETFLAGLRQTQPPALPEGLKRLAS